MADRKMTLKRAPERPELDELLERAKWIKMTDEDWIEQRVSFVYGNAAKKSRITKEEARASVRGSQFPIRLTGD